MGSISFHLPPGFTNLQFITAGGLIAASIKILLITAIVLFFFSLLIGGIQFIISGGQKEKTEAAKNRIVSAVIGLVIVFTAWAITALVNEFFGVNLFSLRIPRL